MGIAAQVVEDVFGAAKGWFGVNHPVGFFKWGQVLGESFRLSESFQRGEELELAVVKGSPEVFEKQTAEQAGEHAYRQKESRTAGDPALTVRADTAARHHTMQMRMKEQVLPPTVQDGEKTDLDTQVFGISSDGA